jgi:ABC-type branched-subunit amino acid transport system substrate-binding protein
MKEWLMKNVVIFMSAFLSIIGASAGELVVATVAPFTGPLAENAQGNYIGAKAYFDYVNAKGGVNGNTIKLVREDDRFEPAETVRLVEMMAKRDKPVTFVNMIGTGVKFLIQEKTLEKISIPVLGVTPGSEAFRSSKNNYFFHLQAGDHEQLEKILQHVSTLGTKRIAVVYQDLPFGKDGLEYIQTAAPRIGLSLVGNAMMGTQPADVAKAVTALAATNAQAYIMVLAPNLAPAFVQAARAKDAATPLYGMSYITPAALVKTAGATGAAGVALAQVTPNPESTSTGFVRDYQAVMTKYAPAGTPFTPYSLMGYLAARVTVEGLKRAGPTPTPVSFADAVSKIRDLDFGGYGIDFSSSNHVGSKYVNIGVVNRSGRLTY